MSCRFQLTNGKFTLTSGVDYSADMVWLYCIFDKYRVYSSDYGANFNVLLQKPVSTIQLNRTLILGRLSQGIQKYVPKVSAKTVDIGYANGDRETLRVFIGYSAVLDNKTEVFNVVFV